MPLNTSKTTLLYQSMRRQRCQGGATNQTIKDGTITNAMLGVADANNNVAIGTDTLTNTTGDRNTAYGSESLQQNTTGDRNTASGYQSLQQNTTGTQNTASGVFSLQQNTTGEWNTASGSYSLTKNTIGTWNTASGYCSIQRNTTGNDNTASGSYSLQQNTTGSNNTALGYQAGDVITDGSNNVIIGARADPSGATASNQIVIGYNAVGKGDKTAVIGNADVDDIYMNHEGTAKIHANATINTSDLRLKKDIDDVDIGLNFISKLRPVTYRWKDDKQDGNKLHHGLIAQEVESVSETHNMSKDTHSIVNYDDANDKYGINYSELICLLIKAVQESDARTTALERENTELKKRLDQMEPLLNK